MITERMLHCAAKPMGNEAYRAWFDRPTFLSHRQKMVKMGADAQNRSRDRGVQ